MSNSNKLLKLSKTESINSNKNKWLDDETAAYKFDDKRISKRFRGLIKQMWDSLGESLPFAYQDWANTKATYRFFSNKKVG